MVSRLNSRISRPVRLPKHFLLRNDFHEYTDCSVRVGFGPITMKKLIISASWLHKTLPCPQEPSTFAFQECSMPAFSSSARAMPNDARKKRGEFRCSLKYEVGFFSKASNSLPPSKCRNILLFVTFASKWLKPAFMWQTALATRRRSFARF